MEENNANVPEKSNGAAPATELKQSHWIGLVAIVAFFILGGWSYCPWYMWIVFALLALLTFGGVFKWLQLILGICVILWGTPLLDGGSHSSSSSSSSSSEYHQQSSSQSESDRRYIEGQLDQIRSLQREFDRAVDMGLPDSEQKRIADQAWAIKQRLDQMDLTKDQQYELHKLFAL